MRRNGTCRIGRQSGGGRTGGAHGVTGQPVWARNRAAKVDGAPGRHEQSAEALCIDHFTLNAQQVARRRQERGKHTSKGWGGEGIKAQQKWGP